ncbi:hypothetical protein AALT_g11949 [Alternaria alternata]|nr:hypothetical protein AALT_g11949 [Alternaria alternata]
MRKSKRERGNDQTEIATSIPASLSSARGDGHKDPLPILKELLQWPISLLAAFADSGTILSGSRAVGGAHNETSDFDLYQIADKGALINIVSVLNFARIQWQNLLLSQIEEEVVAHGLAVIPMEEIDRLVVGVFHKRNWGRQQDIEEYLSSVLKRSESYEKYKDLPAQFTHALEMCSGPTWEENRLWVYTPGADSGRCIRKLPSAITEPVSELLEALPNYSNVDDKDLLEEIPDEKAMEGVKEAWRAEGYADPMLRKWLRYQTIDRAPWVREEVETLLNTILHVNQTESRPTDTEPQFAKLYGPFKILRGTLPNKKQVQLMLIPPKRKDGKREYGIIRTVLDYHATHPMAFIGGAQGGHLYYDTASQGISSKLDFRNDPRHKHAEEGIVKMEKRGWTFRDMGKHRLRRSALDRSTHLTEYEDIYKSARERVGKSNEELPKKWNQYFGERRRAIETYTWLEEDGRITEINNIAESTEINNIAKSWLFQLKPPELLSNWVHDKLSGHEDVIPKDQWEARDLLKAELDLWFGGYKQDWHDDLCHLL